MGTLLILGYSWYIIGIQYDIIGIVNVWYNSPDNWDWRNLPFAPGKVCGIWVVRAFNCWPLVYPLVDHWWNTHLQLRLLKIWNQKIWGVYLLVYLDKWRQKKHGFIDTWSMICPTVAGKLTPMYNVTYSIYIYYMWLIITTPLRPHWNHA